MLGFTQHAILDHLTTVAGRHIGPDADPRGKIGIMPLAHFVLWSDDHIDEASVAA
jgi:hypothetical protein